MNRFSAGIPGRLRHGAQADVAIDAAAPRAAMRLQTRVQKRFLHSAVAALALLAAQPILGGMPAMAQSGQFAPVVYVNGKAVTGYEIEQRQLFLRILGQPGDLAAAARKNLIEDRLGSYAAAQLGLKLSPNDVSRGMSEFASRANLSVEEFTKALGEAGVSQETFRDFVTAQITWRELIRGKYLHGIKISDVEIDRALAAQSRSAAVRVLLSELVIPVQDDPSDEMALARQIQAETHGEAAFAAAARQYSASQTAERGGRIDWMPLANLPPALRNEILALKPGGITAPLSVPNAVVLLQLRAVADEAAKPSADQTLKYAQYLVADGPDAAAELTKVRGKVDSCNDLLAYARRLPAEQMLLDTKKLSEVPKDIALELAKLDPGESSTALRRGNARVFLMLCARNAVEKDDPSREEVRQQLVGQRLAAMADVYMEELRSEAIIRTP